eukprot:4379477-Amphidinium_carterae.1
MKTSRIQQRRQQVLPMPLPACPGRVARRAIGKPRVVKQIPPAYPGLEGAACKQTKEKHSSKCCQCPSRLAQGGWQGGCLANHE